MTAPRADSELDWFAFAGQLEAAVFDINRTIRMGILPPIIYRNKYPTQTEEKPMSITGLQAGAVQAALQKIRDRQAQSLAKLAGATTKAGSVADAMDAVSTKIEKETDDALAEIGQFDNGGPA